MIYASPAEKGVEERIQPGKLGTTSSFMSWIHRYKT